MVLNDLLSFTRLLLAEPTQTPTGRWSDADLITFINQAQTQIALEIDWPESTVSGYTTTNIQEYQMPELLKILRVYVAGQPIVPTTIPALQGDQIMMYDMTAKNYQTQWQSQPTGAYPFASAATSPTGGNTPWQQGERPRFYMRGGNMGFVPIPSGSYYVQVDLVPQPPILVNSTDVSIYQTNFKDAICWKAVEYAMFSDSNSMMTTATANYQIEAGKLRDWRVNLQETLSKAPFPITHRTYFRAPINRIPQSQGRAGG